MSRKRFFILFALVCVVVLLWVGKSKQSNPTIRTATTSRSSKQKEDKVSSPVSTSSVQTLVNAQASAETQQKLFVNAFKTPIAFYGRVIDQDGGPVPQADVKLAANNDPFGGQPSKYSLKSDDSGLFSIEGINGLSLAVEVSKPGYRVIPRVTGERASSGLFEYSVSPSSVRGAHVPNSNVPVLFVLYKPKPAENIVKIGEKNFRIARNGLPLRISLDSQGIGKHEIVLRCWNNDLDRPQGQHQYDWRLEIIVPDGGLLVRNNAFAFEAPNGGYTFGDTIDMPASLPPGQWRGSAERSYFIRYNDGIFARANLEIRAGGDHFVVWQSFLNPTRGSRNLEYDLTKDAGLSRK